MKHITNRHIIIMGVTGSGKTSVGKSLAFELGTVFLDADDYHPESNLKKMKSGTPLEDQDRIPWLREVGKVMSAQDHCIMACSALKFRYRDVLREFVPGVVFVHLSPNREELQIRLDNRELHFMPKSLLDSQLEALEPLLDSERGFSIQRNLSLQETLDTVLESLSFKNGAVSG